jgi:methanogenic corrinoid protein MtbC1
MSPQQEVLVERFIEALISGQRHAARQVIDECLQADAPAESIIENLFWPTLDKVETLYRRDHLSVLSHQFATRIMRMLADQLQLRLERRDPNGSRILLLCGPNEPNELAGQMAADVLEAAGYDVFFAGGGVANDEIGAALTQLDPKALIIFSSVPGDLPHIRQLIDHLHDHNICPKLQLVVGGGVFNRAEGLAEEIGADLWADSPADLVKQLSDNPDKRMTSDQRTVGRRRRQTRAA